MICCRWRRRLFRRRQVKNIEGRCDNPNKLHIHFPLVYLQKALAHIYTEHRAYISRQLFGSHSSCLNCQWRRRRRRSSKRRRVRWTRSNSDYRPFFEFQSQSLSQRYRYTHNDNEEELFPLSLSLRNAFITSVNNFFFVSIKRRRERMSVCLRRKSEQLWWLPIIWRLRPL